MTRSAETRESDSYSVEEGLSFMCLIDGQIRPPRILPFGLNKRRNDDLSASAAEVSIYTKMTSYQFGLATRS
jgi:hypothetical protein